MSRVGFIPVEVPDGVTVEFSGRIMTAKGKLGELSLEFVEEVNPTMEDGKIWVKPADNSLNARKLWGTFRSLAHNVVQGVHEGFTKQLQINGVGYRAQLQGNNLILQLGYSHEINYPVPDGVKIDCPSQTEINITGADKQLVGSVAAKIRSFRPPEPYKGKGIKYKDELIVRKEGKKK
jgi:large subunit ribosomal protein L6